MANTNNAVDRRKFIKQASLATLASGALLSWNTPPLNATASTINDRNIVGPKDGYSPQVGTLVSMMNWMRHVILMPVQGMSTSDLDYLVDDKANSIGAMLYHLAATERFYQIHTFENRAWGDWDAADTEEFGVAMGLGDAARASIKGNPLEFYMEKLDRVRENSLTELAKRDDDWLMTVDQEWPWGPTNNYCKWFHVVEHESNHNGQFKFIRSRIS
ncbi:DUF664 domain-containing protein [Gilvibacter sediminis]|uniref:mycothiol transferase n=1 Tax=Gilvibacter sediminis TaxID=379071 RepID=UPI00234FECED|nr:DUF664 domain-containing protein [Gilvibacter sediminis]MDC7998844.1 DUF664 domain-containing protein [Gilvibacter sediminis]